MLQLAIILFLITAVFGVINLIAVLKSRKTPKLSVLAHGIIALFALFALISYMVTVSNLSALLISSLIFFGIAALAGFTLLMYDMSNKPIPKLFALFHPFIAAIGLILLLIYFFQLS